MGPKSMCTIVEWDSGGWAVRIARRAKACLARSLEASWDVALVDAEASGRPAICASRVHLERRPLTTYSLFVVSAGGVGMIAVNGRFRECLEWGRADLVIVDCRIDGLDTMCRAVQSLPRWPIAYLPEADSEQGVHALEALMRKLARRLVTLSTPEYTVKA